MRNACELAKLDMHTNVSNSVCISLGPRFVKHRFKLTSTRGTTFSRKRKNKLGKRI